MYQERFYRQQVSSKYKLEVCFLQSDILICSDKEIDKAIADQALKNYYRQIEACIEKNPAFRTSLIPLNEDIESPAIVRDMLSASKLSGIGPFSAVAGAVAQHLGQGLLKFCSEIMVENGGDIFLKINDDKILSVYSGSKPESITLKIRKRAHAFGIASSSASIGPSLNFGNAEVLTVIAKDAIIADTFATAFSNKIKKPADVDKVLKEAKKLDFIEAMVIVFGGKAFLQGDIELA